MLDAENTVIIGEGSVDLGSERLDLRLVPKPRKASPLSIAATVEVKGLLTRPVIKVVKGSLLTSSTEAIVKNIGSLTGVRQVWGKLRGGASDRSLCAELVGGKP